MKNYFQIWHLGISLLNLCQRRPSEMPLQWHFMVGGERLLDNEEHGTPSRAKPTCSRCRQPWDTGLLHRHCRDGRWLLSVQHWGTKQAEMLYRKAARQNLELWATGRNSPTGWRSGTSAKTAHPGIPVVDGGVQGYSSPNDVFGFLQPKHGHVDVISSSLLILQTPALPNPWRDLVYMGQAQVPASPQREQEPKRGKSALQISLEHRSPNPRLYPCTLNRFIQTLQNSHQEIWGMVMCTVSTFFPGQK